MAEEQEQVTLTIPLGDVSQLRDLARQLGFVTTAGRMHGLGNVSGLLKAIARGHYTIVPGRLEAEPRPLRVVESAAPLAPDLATLKLSPLGSTDRDELLHYAEQCAFLGNAAWKRIRELEKHIREVET